MPTMNTIANILKYFHANSLIFMISQMVFFPENSDYVAECMEEALQLAEGEDGNFIRKCKNLSKELDIWVSLTFHNKVAWSFKSDFIMIFLSFYFFIEMMKQLGNHSKLGFKKIIFFNNFEFI